MHEQKKICIVDDDVIHTYLIKELFAHRNETLIYLDKGEDAIDYIKEHPEVSLILMDIKLPGMSGFEAAREIKNITPHIPIIAITALMTPEIEQKSWFSGCDDYMAKPFPMEAFWQKLEHFL